MELALIIFGLLCLIIFLYRVRKNKKQSNKDIYPHFWYVSKNVKRRGNIFFIFSSFFWTMS